MVLLVQTLRGVLPIWDEFVEGLLVRFGFSEYENVDERHSKIRQATMVL